MEVARMSLVPMNRRAETTTGPTWVHTGTIDLLADPPRITSETRYYDDTDKQGWYLQRFRKVVPSPEHSNAREYRLTGKPVYLGPDAPADLPADYPKGNVFITKGWRYHSPAIWVCEEGHRHVVWVEADGPCQGERGHVLSHADAFGWPIGVLNCFECPLMGYAEYPEGEGPPPDMQGDPDYGYPAPTATEGGAA